MNLKVKSGLDIKRSVRIPVEGTTIVRVLENIEKYIESNGNGV